MKKKLLAISIIPFYATAAEYVSIVSGNQKDYISGMEETETVSGWSDLGSPQCSYDIVEEDVYYGKTATQNQDCQQEQERTVTVTKKYSDGREDVTTHKEKQTIDADKTVQITGTHLEKTCANIRDNGYSLGDLDYHIEHNGSPLSVYCEMSRDNGGWMLVRRINNNWNSFSDDLQGTEIVGTYTPNPLSPNTFGMKFDDFNYTEFLFTTGDKQKWLITNTTSVYDGWTSSMSCGDAQGQVLKSSSSQNPSTVGWCKRHSRNEDPWISIETHGHGGNSGSSNSFSHSMLYGERNADAPTATTWAYYLQNLNGVSIYVR